LSMTKAKINLGLTRGCLGKRSSLVSTLARSKANFGYDQG